MEQPPIYILMLSIHGLVRGHDLELGRDADTGGQVTYVIELARALGRHPGVERVDLLTRLINDPQVSDDYAAAEEKLGPRARIVRLPFGRRRSPLAAEKIKEQHHGYRGTKPKRTIHHKAARPSRQPIFYLCHR